MMNLEQIKNLWFEITGPGSERISVVGSELLFAFDSSVLIWRKVFMTSQFMNALHERFPDCGITGHKFCVSKSAVALAAERSSLAPKPTYAEKLRDPRWQRRRLEIMQRDGFTCQICHDDQNTLNVHHRWYARGNDPWDYPDECLVTLCEDCHQQETENRQSCELDLLATIRRRYFFGDLIQIEKLLHSMPHVVAAEVQLSALAWFVSDEQRLKNVVALFMDSGAPAIAPPCCGANSGNRIAKQREACA